MNSRKFYLVLSTIVSIFLFTAGVLILNYINQQSTDDSTPKDKLFGSVIDNFKTSRSPFNILVLGGDKVNKNTDTMMLVNFDPTSAKINVMSIPRDTKVKIDGTYHKINFAFPHGGAELAAETVSELLDVNIKYYVFVDTSAFRKIIDLLGGVDFYIPVDMNYDDPLQNLHIHLKKGQQHLNGAKAEQFMRFRHPNSFNSKELKKYYDGSDLKRIEAQQSFLKELIRQKANILYLPKLNNVIDVVYENLETNITLSEIAKLVKSVRNFNANNVNMLTLPGTTADGSPWYYVCDREKADELAKQYFNAKGSFVNYSNKNSDKTDTQTGSGTKKSTAQKSFGSTGTKKSVTKNNPSNGETSVKGSATPAP